MERDILIMVGMYREWEAERSKEAMETIAKIAEVIEAWEEFKMAAQVTNVLVKLEIL